MQFRVNEQISLWHKQGLAGGLENWKGKNGTEHLPFQQEIGRPHFCVGYTSKTTEDIEVQICCSALRRAVEI